MSNETIETYDYIATKYSGDNYDHFWVNEFTHFRSKVPGKKILDIGCGAGRDAEEFIKNGFNYVGIDASKGMLEVAQERVESATFLKMNFLNLEFEPQAFDGFWAAASLLHIPKKDLSTALSEIKRVIRPRAYGFISMRNQGDRNEGVVRQEKYENRGRYFAFYLQDEFAKNLEKAGFSIDTTWTKEEKDGTSWFCFFIRNH